MIVIWRIVAETSVNTGGKQIKKERFTFWKMKRGRNPLVHRKQMSKLKGYLLPEEGRSDKVRIRKKIDRGRALTSWKRQRSREGYVRTRKESGQARGTHSLKTAEVRTIQDTERKPLSEGHSLPGDRRGGQVRQRKESDQTSDTYSLETAEGRSSQDTGRKWLNEGHARTGRQREGQV